MKNKTTSFLNWIITGCITLTAPILVFINIRKDSLNSTDSLETLNYLYVALIAITGGVIFLPKLAKYVEEGSRVNLLSELKNVSAALENKSKD